MSQEYNPIVRTFGRVRGVLLGNLALSRQQIRPETPLETLVPREHQHEICLELDSALQRQVSMIVFPILAMVVPLAAVIMAAALSGALWNPIPMLVTIPVCLVILCCWPTRLLSRQFPPALQTVGDLVLYLTHIPEHKQSGYRWTKNEISRKIRLILAMNLGLPLDKVRPETSFNELWG